MSDAKKLSRREWSWPPSALLPMGMARERWRKLRPATAARVPGRGQARRGCDIWHAEAPAVVPLEKTPLFEPEGANKQWAWKGDLPRPVVWVHNPRWRLGTGRRANGGMTQTPTKE